MRTSRAKPPVKVIVGPAHSGKTARILSSFRQSMAQGEEATLLLPTAHAASSLRRELLLEGTFDFLGGPRLLTFIQFAERVLEHHAPEVQPIGPLVEDELLARIVAGLAGEKQITYHANVLNFHGFVRAVRAFIMELKRAEITPDDFARFARRRGASARDRELSEIYSRYQKTLRDLNLYDEEGRFWWAKLLVSEGKLGPFAGLRRLFLDGFYDFTPAQLGLIEVLARHGVDLAMTLPLEEDSKRKELFESAEATLAKLRERFEPSLEVLPLKEPGRADLGWVARHLFRSGVPSDPPRPESIQLIETPGTAAEVREIAREIKRLHVEESTPLERIALVFRTLADYRSIVEDVFDEFGIPVRLGRGVRLSLTPVGQLVLHVLRVPAEGWRSRDVMSLLKSNYVSASALALDGELPTLPRFEGLAAEAGIIRGRESWTRNFRALRENIASQLESAEVDFDDEVRHRLDPAELREKIRHLEEAERVSGKLFELFDGLEHAETVQSLVDALLDVIRRLGVQENLLAKTRQELAARDLESLAAACECLTSLVRTASIVGSPRCALADFVKNVSLAFSDKEVSRRGTDFGCVQVHEVHEVRALAFDVVFIGGLLERSFPRMHREGPFYDDAERVRMTETGISVQPRRLDQREERFLFYLAATRASKRLYLSYPVTDREGKEKLVSYYVGEVKRLFSPYEIGSLKVTLSTRVAGVDRSASREELRRAAVLRLSEPRLSEPAKLMRAAGLLWAVEPRSALVLKRGLEGEAERDSWDAFGPHDAVMTHPEALRELAGRFGADYDFSVTRLEEYGCCPFAFFCRSVLDIEAPVEPPEELEAVDEGKILHRVLREFYSERRRTMEDVRIDADQVEEAAKRISQIADSRLDYFRRHNPDLNEGLFRLQRERMHELLADFVRAEVENRRKDAFDMVPRHFEVAFGLAVNPRVADPRSSPRRLVVDIEGEVPAGIVGKIDRIDLTDLPLGGGKARGFRVIDYKRSQPTAGKGEILDGTAFQMPVYLLAAAGVIFRGEGLEPVDAHYYALRKMRLSAAIRRLKRTKQGVEEVPDWSEQMDAAVGFIRDYVRAIRHGEFPVMRRGKDPCPGYCDFREICRYSEWRAMKKLGKAKPWFESGSRPGTGEAKTNE